MSEEEVLFLDCACYSPEHTIHLCRYNEDKFDESVIYVHIHLKKERLLRRILYAIKYVFGYKCEYGCFDEFIVNPESALRMRDFLNRFLKDQK